MWQRNKLMSIIFVFISTNALFLSLLFSTHFPPSTPAFKTTALPYPIVSTGQTECFNDEGQVIPPPKPGEAFFGQDAQIPQRKPAYRDNGDGTVTDLNTGLMWTRDPGPKKTYQEAVAGARQCRVGGYDDWRLPTVKELYSLILFSGVDLRPESKSIAGARPFIDINFFIFHYGQLEMGERLIDAQYATATLYTGRGFGQQSLMFGVNFADGRIKAYPTNHKTYYVLYVRGNPNYGQNDFHDNGDGTVTDRATGLMWMKIDSGHLKAGQRQDGRMTWREALDWAANLTFAGYSDWRLPTAKELQSIVDYTRSPDATNSPAIDPVFEVTQIVNEGGEKDYPYFWTGTTHVGPAGGREAVYISFGRGLGWLLKPAGGQRTPVDIHGAGCQRSDPKTGDPKKYPFGRGPQGDVVRIYNYVRCVRNIKTNSETKISPQIPGKENDNSNANVSSSTANFNILESTSAKQKKDESSLNQGLTAEQRRPFRQRGENLSVLFHPASEFSLIIIGSGSPQFNPERSGPSALVQYRQHYYLVDMGNGTQARLHELGVPLKDLAAILLTHHHLDHNEEFIPIMIYRLLRSGGFDIIGPPETKKLVNFVLQFYEEDIAYRLRRQGRFQANNREPVVREVKGGESFRLGDIKVTTARVNHTIYTVAYRFEVAQQSIVISGDTAYSENLIELAREADILLLDSGESIIRPGAEYRSGLRAQLNQAHPSLQDVCSMAEKARAKKIVLTHINPGKIDEESTIKTISERYHGKVIIARDLQEITPDKY